MSNEQKGLEQKVTGVAFRSKCTYQFTDRNTGEQRTCQDKAVSADYPYCFKHLRQTGNPLARRAGRYEDSMPDAMRENYEHQLSDDRPQDLSPEIAQARAAISLQWERIRGVVDEDGKVVVTFKDLEYVMALMEQVRKMTETQARVNPEDFVPVSEVVTMFDELINIIRKNIPSDQMSLREKLAAEIKKYCIGEMSAKIVQVTAGNAPRASKSE